jgi:hypothetical protein
MDWFLRTTGQPVKRAERQAEELMRNRQTSCSHSVRCLRYPIAEKALADLIKDGGPILHHGDSFESTCRRLWRFLNQSQG